MFNFNKIINNYKEEIIKHTIELIKFESVLIENEEKDNKVYRFGYQNYKALEYILNLGKSMGFKTGLVDGVCGHIEYGEGEEIFAVLTHLDVVPAPGNWTFGPFEGIVSDNKLYGRGAIDNKGPAIVSLFALKMIKDLNIKLNKKIRLIFGTDEESGSRCLQRYLEVEKMPTMAISPDADFPVIYAEKGMITIDLVGPEETSFKALGGDRYNIVASHVEIVANDSGLNFELKNENLKEVSQNTYFIEGLSAHAMEPDNGINAIKIFASIMNKYTNNKLIKFINKYLLNSRLKDINLDCYDEQMGELTMNMGLLDIGDESRLGINIRYPLNLNYDNFIKTLKEKAIEYDLEIKVISHSKHHYIDPNSKFIKTLSDIYKYYTNDFTPNKTIGGGTYARNIKNAVAFGIKFPNEKCLAHEVDEYVDLDNLFLSCAIIASCINELGN